MKTSALLEQPGLSNDDRAVLELAIRLALDAGAIQRERYESDFQIQTKRTAIDLVTEVDRACEKLIVDAIRRERPEDSILAEEGSGVDQPGADWCWIIDPLDGTSNYAHGFPRFCVSIGIEYHGERQAGVVYDPLLDELYSAVRGSGAYLGHRKLRVSDEARLDRSMLATGFAYDVRDSESDNVSNFSRIVKTARALRRDGSAALDLCYVAAARLDGYWEFKLHPWDVAAGYLIVAEAGGVCSDLSGGPAPRSGVSVLASNGKLHDAMLEVLEA